MRASMPNSRASLLRALIEYREPIDQTIAGLSALEWDVEEPEAHITPQDVKSIVGRYLRSELTSLQLTDWADLVECRDDIAYSSHTNELSDIVFRLANPNLRDEITPKLATEILQELNGLQQ
jgi:hypothetical protein